VFIFPNRYSYDFTTLFEVLIKLLVVSTKINIPNEDTAIIRIIFNNSLFSLTEIVMRGMQGY